MDIDKIGNVSNHFQQFFVGFFLKLKFQFNIYIEMVLDGSLAFLFVVK